MRGLLDTNIVLDVMLKRVPWHVDADAVLDATRDGRVTAAMTSLTIANIYYVACRLVGAVRARQIVRDCLLAFEVLPVDRQTLSEADQFPGTDFEDNIQIAAATIAGVDFIVTRDRTGITASPIAVLSPAELVVRLPPPPP